MIRIFRTITERKKFRDLKILNVTDHGDDNETLVMIALIMIEMRTVAQFEYLRHNIHAPPTKTITPIPNKPGLTVVPTATVLAPKDWREEKTPTVAPW